LFLTSPTITIFRLRAGRRQPRRREADQLDELAEILRDRRERAFVARAGHATQASEFFSQQILQRDVVEHGVGFSWRNFRGVTAVAPTELVNSQEQPKK
jgi:hypothetical protein